ncbi:MAG: prenyltransferase [Deltaproteobacteria bacterium]|nr:prenyltransferase [Deltaproteobacteria bacterium]
MPPKLKTYFFATRPHFFPAIILPLCLGTAVAWHYNHAFYPGYFALALLAAILYHGGINVLNDYFDYLNGTDNLNRTGLPPFTGGSRMIQKGLLTPEGTYLFGLVLLLLGSIIGLYLSYERGYKLLYIGITGLLSGYLYSAPPLFLASRGIGELLVGINFGVLTVIGSYYVQTGDITPEAVFASLPLSFLIAGLLYINEFPDYEADKAVGKNNLVVYLGKERARWGFVILILGAYISLLLGVILRYLPSLTLLAFVSAIFGVRAVKGLYKNFDKTSELTQSIKASILTHVLTGLILTITLIL